MIHPSGTFEYGAEFTSESFSQSDVVLHGTAKDTTCACLVGHNPRIRFWNNRVVLVASQQSNSTVRNASFRIGTAVPLLAQSGDRLYIVRTGAGGIGLSLLRDDSLILAVGAVASVPLGTEVSAIKCPERTIGLTERIRNTWLEFQVGSERAELREREITQLGDYQIYIEYDWQDNIPGVDECVSICRADTAALRIAALRSAILLGHGDMKLTLWDNTERVVYSDPGFPDFTWQ